MSQSVRFARSALGTLAVTFGTLIVCNLCYSAPAPELVVYTSVERKLSEPAFVAFEAETHIRLRVVYDSDSPTSMGVLGRVVSEVRDPQADVLWSGDPLQLLQLDKHGLVQPYTSPQVADLPESARTRDGTWSGLAASASVLLVNRDRVPANDMPRSIRDLASPRWRDQTALANPLFGTALLHMAALFAVWGDENTQVFLNDLRAYGARVLGNSGEVKRLVAAGELAFGLVDSGDAYEAVAEGANVEVVYPDQNGQGTFVLPTALGLLRNAPHPEAARRLIDYLLSPAAERRFVERCARVPLRAAATAPERRPAAGLRMMQVDYAHVFDLLEAQRKRGWLRRWVGL